MQYPPRGPHGKANYDLNGVSCTSTKACIAVGSSDVNGRGYTCISMVDCFPVAAPVERWNGRKWSIQHTRGLGNLQNVSCATKNSCMAVDWNGQTAARWDGHRWTVQTLNPPPGRRASISATCRVCQRRAAKPWDGLVARRWRSTGTVRRGRSSRRLESLGRSVRSCMECRARCASAVQPSEASSGTVRTGSRWAYRSSSIDPKRRHERPSTAPTRPRSSGQLNGFAFELGTRRRYPIRPDPGPIRAVMGRRRPPLLAMS
jgi:hypothetical protein